MNNIGVYERLGVRRIINAWGVSTELGGWAQTENVTKAMEEANRSPVEMRELLQKSGDFIADLLGVEAAFVTSGAAAAQALSVAACMAGTDPDRIAQLPDTTGMKNEVVIQKRNRYMFDRCYTLTGATSSMPGTTKGRARTTWTPPSGRTRSPWPTTSSRPSMTPSFRWKIRSLSRDRGAFLRLATPARKYTRSTIFVNARSLPIS